MANGRSSDFILTGCSVFPEISKPHPSDSALTPVTLLATPKKGLTASGNVGDFHPIPYSPPRRLPAAGRHLRISRYSIIVLMIAHLRPFVNPAGKEILKSKIEKKL
jgi:hypothetical protein